MPDAPDDGPDDSPDDRLDALLDRLRRRAADPERRVDRRETEFSAWVASLDVDEMVAAAAAAQAELAKLLESGPAAALDPSVSELAARLSSAMATPADTPLPPPAPPAAVDEAEAALGFPLPAVLRRVLLDVANGGVGPGFGLLGVAGGWTEQGADLVDLYRRHRRGTPFDAWEWPAGLLPVAGLDGTVVACADTTRPDDPVVVWDADAIDPDAPVVPTELSPPYRGQEGFRDVSDSLLAWIEMWLDAGEEPAT